MLRKKKKPKQRNTTCHSRIVATAPSQGLDTRKDREESLNSTTVFFKKRNIMSYSVLKKDVISSGKPPRRGGGHNASMTLGKSLLVNN